MVIPATSTEYIHIPVTLPAGVDPGSSPVRIAVVAHRNNPADTEWHTADWIGSDARILIGPDSEALTLVRGDYRVWINVDPPGAENIVELAGHLGVI